MKSEPEHGDQNAEGRSLSDRSLPSRMPSEGLADHRFSTAEPSSSLSYQVVTIAAAVLLVVSAAVLW